jgi:hypothetical protein
MADDRLKQVRQTDLTESRVNEDFVVWLRRSGPQYLLIVMIAVCGWLGYLRWKEYRAKHVAEAWSAYLECKLPGSFEDVADQYSDVPGLQQQAWREAADTLLEAVQSGRRLGADASKPATAGADVELSDAERAEYLDRAERLYRQVVDSDDHTLARTLYTASALQGLAAVAESRGNADEARNLYEMSADRAEPFYPLLAQRVRERAKTVAENITPVTLPAQASLPSPLPPASSTPATIDPALRSTLLPEGG